ncbi:cation diffusion facilitator family transporter [Bradyrhizobium diazoefficiens]|uniref:Putative Cation efflux system protein czcD n=1 Tax=Bradyrhizobium diazoefficiens SEMIA 5080 TaxID=754504 RepID=A0A837CNF6_9BRAD|nr:MULTISPECIES: cation diffusion facilitator family transporter [Bradyrhizobium]APO52948.1 cobalt transporter [Bradyrhizobium diazoefficiens]KGJ70515.1 putative Cation efflux system protein czcD [Bradyrhizobium diazoefficiens SEMIA 5080]KOY08844.1 cobalt transporter [Bradyrhizobium diazoefficiens]MCD9297227.1 cation diffusion facilitator family transporter [Bradyrhizobium diazoefficiens]MCD9814528.1 cation diffusion facilitator family transporter [Bradyrhizobium diazoefficiens]
MGSHDHHGDHHHDDAGHGHDHGRGLGHAHVHAPASFGKAFAIGISLNTALVVAEAVYGYIGNSTALLADAGHNLSDVLGLVVAWGAAIAARRAPSGRFTYGLRASTILAALANAVFLLVATGAIGWEAILRLREPEPVAGVTVMVVAGIGILVNGFTAMLFASGRKDDINIEGAYLHMAADAAVSLGVVVSAALIIWTGWLWLDPVTSLVICAAILWSTTSLLRGSIDMSMAAAPKGTDLAAIRALLLARPGVSAIHDLHVWPISTTETALTCHLVMPAGSGDAFLMETAQMLKTSFRIGHTTLQVETHPDNGCALAPDDVV